MPELLPTSFAFAKGECRPKKDIDSTWAATGAVDLLPLLLSLVVATLDVNLLDMALMDLSMTRLLMMWMLMMWLALLGFSVTAAAAHDAIPYTRAGVMAWNVGPQTAVWWPKTFSMVVYEAARFCKADDTYWPPSAAGALQPYSNSSYFRIRDMTTGAVLGNVQGSQCFAYGSLVVDPVLQRAWVFGSERDLCAGKNKTQNSACKPYWQWRSSAGDGIRAWWSDDLATWHTAAAPALMFPDYPFNTDVTPVANKSLLRGAIFDDASLRPADVANAEPLNFVMVSENGRIATHSSPDRNLSSGWRFFGKCGRADVAVGAKPPACKNPPCHRPGCGFGPCPAVHYGEEDGFFYVISGGSEIALARTRDLTTWEHAPPLVTYDRSQDAKLSPYMNIAAQAKGEAPATLEHKAAAKRLRAIVSHPQCWESFVNDADMCCGGPLTAPGAPTDKAFVLYSPSSQGAPALKNCSTSLAHMATDFNGVATADVSLTKLLASRFTKRAKAKTGDAAVTATAWQTVAPAAAAPNDPHCSVSGDPDGQVITWIDRGPHRRCIAIVAPPRPAARLPVLFYFHGSGGNAAGCDKLPLAAVAKQNGFALVCGEAVQDPETGGQWDMPNVITDRTGTPCDDKDSHDVGYIKGALAQLSKVGRFDLSRIFFSGCSQGSGFSSYISTCTKQNPATAANLSAFATHSTGLKTKGDGVKWGCCSDIESCEECQYFPFAPYIVPHADTLGLKACIFDNVGDRLPRNAPMPTGKGFFYESSVEMAKVWRARGNRAETHFGGGGHCEIHSYYAIAKCLDDGTGRLCHEAGCTNRSAVTVKSDDSGNK